MYFCNMILSKAIALAENGKPHSFEFVAKGSEKRQGGYTVKMENTIVTSSNHERQKMNLHCLDSKQTRWCYFVLLTKIDGHEIFI